MNAGQDIRKPLRARKTMTPSSRRQIEILRRAKEGADVASKGASTEKKDLCVTSSSVEQFLNGGALQDILYSWYEKESVSLVCKPVEVHLNIEPAGWTPDCSEERFSVSSPAKGTPASSTVTNTGETIVDKSIPVLEREDVGFELHKNNATSLVPDNPERKRTLEECKDVFCKHMRMSDEAREGCQGSSDKRQPGLGKVKDFIQQQLTASMRTLDDQLQLLNERINHTHCLRKHEGIVIKIVKKISRLDKRINGAIASQNTGLSSKVHLPGAHSQNKILNCTTALPGNTNRREKPSKEVPSNPHKTPSETIERSDDIILLGEVNKRPGVQAVTPPAVQQKEASANMDVSAAAPRNAKDPFVIDLTDDRGNANRAERRRSSAAESQMPNTPQAVPESSDQVPEDFSHLPPLPKIRLHPKLADGFQGTLPPQKLELSVARVKNPKGIAIRWNIKNLDPNCAPIKSFHLFLCCEGSQEGWVNTHQIQAMPLPMACSLTDFPDSTKYYFTMQAKDIYGRYGPFCDIQSIFTV